MYSLPSKEAVKKVVITKETVLNQSEPIMVISKNKQKRLPISEAGAGYKPDLTALPKTADKPAPLTKKNN